MPNNQYKKLWNELNVKFNRLTFREHLIVGYVLEKLSSSENLNNSSVIRAKKKTK